MNNHTDLLYYLQKLINFKTITGNNEEAIKCLSYIKQELLSVPLYIEDFVFNNYPSLLIGTQKSTHYRMIFQAHVDVVPAHHAQFTLLKDNGKLYGRGVFDMKFAIACYIHLLKELAGNLKKYDLAVLFTSDEEIGGENGVKAILNNGLSGNVAIIPDGGDNWCIETSAKGAWLMKFTATGKATHGSRPWHGKSAISKLIKALSKIEALNTNKPNGTTVVVTKVHGGSAVNQVPDVAHATVDIRFNDRNAYETISNQVYKIAQQYDCNVDTHTFVEPVSSDIKNQFITDFRATIASVLHKKPGDINFCQSLGASDGRFFVKKGIPIIVSRPIGSGAHSEDEWIDESAFYQYYEVLRRFVEQHAIKK